MSWKRRDDAELLNAAVRDRAAFAAFYDLHAGRSTAGSRTGPTERERLRPS